MSRRFDKLVTKARGTFASIGGKEQREDPTDRLASRPLPSPSSSVQPGPSSSATVSDHPGQHEAIGEGRPGAGSDIGGGHVAPSPAVAELVPVMGSSSSTTEEFGLFEFPMRTGADAADTQPFKGSENSATSSGSLQHVDIIAVHGVGGHWLNTWQSSDGAVWPRDRIPDLFSDTNIRCRIRSFGYNSASFFTRADINIRDCAKDLIDRIRVLRRRDTDEFRPIVFIAHSLGGILVKEALNRAWARQTHYEDILRAVKGCIFLGVPHRGAAIASWAKHASQLTKFLTLGFAGNTSFLGTLEPDSDEWIRISDDFVERGKDLSLCTFYETKKTGNLMVVDKASAIMHLPNEECFPVQGSDHRTIAKFSNVDNERFSLVGDAVYRIVRGSLKGKQQVVSYQTIIFDLPPVSPHFFGRTRELALLRETLDPSKPGMKGVVLYGLAGSGKSQLVLNFIDACKARYTAIFWVNASTEETTAQSFADIATCIKEIWPAKDLPNPMPRSATAEKRVLSRLLSTVYNRWLLVIDSADDAEATNYTALIPSRCPHGSVIVTSIRRSAADQFEPVGFRSEEIDCMDNQSAGQLLLHTSAAQDKYSLEHTEEPATNEALKIVKELHGIPLAIEQAGVLIRKQIVTFDNFIEEYSKHYKILMAKKPTPGATSYEKEHSVVAIIPLLFSAVRNESPDSARLLQILCVLGHQNIPFDLLKSLARTGSGEPSSSAQNPLAALFSDDTILLLCLSTLRDVCLIKFQDRDSQTDKTISVHGLICRWVVDAIQPDHLGDLAWVVEGVLDYVQPSNDSPIFPYRPDKEATKSPYLSLVKRITGIAQDALKVDFASPSLDPQLARINRKLAYAYLSTDRLQDATKLFEACIELERELNPDSWPSTEISLQLLVGLAVCRQKAGDHQAAIEALRTSLRLAETVFDNFDDRTAEISRRLKVVSERQEVNLQQHKAVVVASTGSADTKEGNCPNIDPAPSADYINRAPTYNMVGGSSTRTHNEPADPGEVRALPPHYRSDDLLLYVARLGEWVRFREQLNLLELSDINVLLFGKTVLMHLLLEHTDTAAQILLDEKSHEIDVEVLDQAGETALFYASLLGHGKIIRRLVKEFGADPNRRNIRGETALDRVIDSGRGSGAIIQQLIEHGAHPDMPDLKATAFMRASLRGNLDIMRILFNSGNVNINRQDYRGNSLLHKKCVVPVADPSIVPLSVKVIGQLVEWGADVNLKNNYGDTALHLLLSNWNGNFAGRLGDFLGLLLARQTDINARNNNGNTVLHIGAITLHETDFRLLVGWEGTDLNAVNGVGQTPLMSAILSTNFSSADVLLERDDVDVNALDEKGMSALFYAIRGFKGASGSEIYWVIGFLILIKWIASFNLGSYGHGETAQFNSVLYAAKEGNERALRLLIKTSRVETQQAIRMADDRGLPGEKALIHRIAAEEHGTLA